MMKWTMAVVAALVLGWTTGCQREQPVPLPEPASAEVAIEETIAAVEAAEETAAERIEEIAVDAEEAVEAAEEMVDDAVDAVEEAVEAAEEMVEEAMEATEEALEEVAAEVTGTALAAVAAVQATAAEAMESAELAEGFTAINSSAMLGVKYDAISETLSIQFPTGDIWDYQNVPAETFEELMASRSKGRFYVQQIKDVFEGARR